MGPENRQLQTIERSIIDAIESMKTRHSFFVSTCIVIAVKRIRSKCCWYGAVGLKEQDDNSLEAKPVDLTIRFD
jgi:hypothetical protein